MNVYNSPTVKKIFHYEIMDLLSDNFNVTKSVQLEEGRLGQKTPNWTIKTYVNLYFVRSLCEYCLICGRLIGRF